MRAEDTNTRHLRRIGALLAVLAAVVIAPAASAAGAPEFLTQFGDGCENVEEITKYECGGAAGETVEASGIAADPRTGHVFVGDGFNQRVDEFTPWGEFVKAFGWDVAPAAVDEQQEVRVRAVAGQFRLSFGADTTPDLPFDAEAAEVEAALNGLASVGEVSVKERKGSLSGASPFVYVVSFESPAATDVAQLVASEGTTPLSGNPTTSLEVNTRADGGPVGTGLETCTEASQCRGGSEGAGSGQFRHPEGIATDSNGDVYVVDSKNHRVEKFDSAGRFQLMFGGGVDQTTTANVCTAASADTCGAGKVGAGAGEFSEWNQGSFIAVGPGDVVYVGDRERIQKFNSNGVAVGEIPLPGKGTVSSLAVAPSGDVAVEFDNLGQDGEAKNPDVRILDPTGAEICTIAVGRPTALASDADGDIYIFASPAYETDEEETSEIREYDPGCEEITTFAVHEFGRGVPHYGGVPYYASGIGISPLGDVYASHEQEDESYARAYGPAPIAFESALPLPPQIAAEYATSVGTETATVGAQINPRFWPDATYYVQYGLENCETSACQQQPLPPGASLTTQAVNDPVATANVSISGLAPGTTYYYRFVATSGGGGPVYGPARTLRTYSQGPPGLPDGRAYELVSPPDKGGGDVGIPGPAGGGARSSNAYVQPQQASPSGAAITYASATPFGGDPKSAPGSSQYLSTRGSGGWSTENLDPRFEEGFLRDPLVGFSPDLSHGALIAIEPPLTADATTGFSDLYQRDNATGALSAITTAEHTPQVAPNASYYCLSYGGASTDSKRVFFSASGALNEGDPVLANGLNLYEWSAGEGLRLVSVLPDGEPAPARETTAFGAPQPTSAGCNSLGALERHAISGDGSRAFWTYKGTYEGAVNPLFARLGGTETVQLDAPNQGVSGAGGEGEYRDASADGSEVFFIDTQKLTQDANVVSKSHADLYRYDFNAPEGERLTDLSAHAGEAADVSGVIGVSEDGTYAYFVAKGALSAAANSHDDTAVAGQFNLYAWHQGDGVRFLATLGQGDQTDWSAQSNYLSARVSPDGGILAFPSIQSLTGFDNVDRTTRKADREVYLYEFASDKLTCASCNPARARPLGPASVPTWSTPFQQPRYLLDDGRLFFETLDSLDPHDTNAKGDVYESEPEGLGTCTGESPTLDSQTARCLYLISGGTSSDDSYFLDASEDGSDAFISTRQSFAYSDADVSYDVYDASVGGHTAQPPPPPRGQLTGPPPIFGTPASATLFGAGNLVPPAAKPATKPKAKPLTRSQKLVKALKACRSKRNKRKRVRCEKSAHRKYGRRK